MPKIELFTPEIDKFGHPAEMVRPNDATQDEFLFVEYEAYRNSQKEFVAARDLLLACRHAMTIASQQPAPSTDWRQMIKSIDTFTGFEANPEAKP